VSKDTRNLNRVVDLHRRIYSRPAVFLEILTRFLTGGEEDAIVIYLEE
jgi:hypothetical protein